MSSLKTFQEEAPEVQQAYAGVINSLIELKHLDAKTKQLLYIAMKIIHDDENAVLHHVPMAKALGVSRDEVKETILLTVSVIGLKGVSNYLDKCLYVFDN